MRGWGSEASAIEDISELGVGHASAVRPALARLYSVVEEGDDRTVIEDDRPPHVVSVALDEDCVAVTDRGADRERAAQL